MKVFITGSNGQLGRELLNQLPQTNHAFVGYDIPEFDLTDKNGMEGIIDTEKPDVIINCGAMTNVDGCETNRDLAMQLNADGPKALAEIAQKRNIVLVQVSTDYVFDGDGIEINGVKRPYLETDPVDPQTVYGESKALGEKAVMASLDKYFIVRTAWLYGDGKNFVKTMINLSQTHPEISVVNDQIGTPTSTVDLAKAILALIETDAYGIYHGTCEGFCSWYDFACEIFRLKSIDVKVRPVSSDEFVSKTPRPKYSVLENKGLINLGLNTFRPWQTAISDYITWLDTQE